LILGVCEDVVAHLEMLSTLFERYFHVGKMETSEEWIMNSCFFNLDKISDDGELIENITELRCVHIVFLKCNLQIKL